MKLKHYILVSIVVFIITYISSLLANVTCYWQEQRIESSFGQNAETKAGLDSDSDFFKDYEFYDGSMISIQQLSTMPTNMKNKKIGVNTIFIPLSLPKTKHQFLRKETLNNFAENNNNFLRNERWDEEGGIVLTKLQQYKCINAGSKILDLGAGHGYYSLIFSQIVGTNGLVYCCDINPAAQYETAQTIRYNQINNSGADFSNIILWLNVPDSTLLRKESIDTIFARDVHFVHEGTPEKNPKLVLWDRENIDLYRDGLIMSIKKQHGYMLQSIYDTLKPDGHFVLLERMCGPGMVQRLDRKGITMLMESYGFKIAADIDDLGKTPKNVTKFKNGEIDHFLIFKK
jgi:predicted methyltransferase